MSDQKPTLRDLVAELKHRRVFQVAATYAAVGFVLVQAAAYVFEALLFPDWAHRLLVVLVLLGFPVALVLAWAFEVTPEGVRTTFGPAEDEAEPDEEAAHPRARRTVVAGVVGVVALTTAAAGWGAWTLWLSPGAADGGGGEVAGAAGPAAGREGGAPSRARTTGSSERPALAPTRIAVLYFDDHSPGGELGHIASGFTEALIHELAQVEGLDVVSRNGVKPFRQPEVPLDSVARVLGAGSLVEGSVDREGGDLLVTVQLVDGTTATHIASRRVRGQTEAPLDLRDTLVEEVTTLLRRELGEEVRLREARTRTRSTEAWELYHLAQEWKEDADSMRADGETATARRLYLQSDSLLSRAEKLDPSWPDPAVSRGWIALSRARLGEPGVSETLREGLREGIAHANRALRLSPGDPAALELRGTLRYFLARTSVAGAADTLEAAERDLRAAVEDDANRARAWARLSYLLQDRGRFTEARWAARRSRKADAFLGNDRDYLYLAAHLALELEELEEARSLTRKGLEQFPREPAFLSQRLLYLASTGDTPEEAEEAWRTVREFESLTRTEKWQNGHLRVAAVLARAGMADSARAVLRGVEMAPPPTPLSWYYAAYVHLQLGEEERALHLLSRYVEALPSRRAYLAHDWWWRPLREDPRFRAIVEAEEPRAP